MTTTPEQPRSTSRGGRCFSPHPGPPKPHCQKLRWTAPDRRALDGRVLTWTCDCQAISYELRQASGLQFIRRTRNEQGTMVIEDSDRWRAAVAAARWNALLTGELR